MFYQEAGKMVIGSRLRLLTDLITEDAKRIYSQYGMDINPKWFPMFYVLAEGKQLGVTDIAQLIGHSHPSVSKMVREMNKAGYVKETKDKADARRNLILLTSKGDEVNEKLKEQYIDVNGAIEELSKRTRNDLWEAIGEWEYLLAEKSLYKRVMDHRKNREANQVRLVNFEAKYESAFRDLNIEWISKFFKMEEADYRSLDDPYSDILSKGGAILVALYDNEPYGVCALKKMDDPEYDYELCKMAVSPKAHGKGIGYKLGLGILQKAKELGANNVYLESNTILVPAINLYEKLGFRKVVGHATPYERCNIQMAVYL